MLKYFQERLKATWKESLRSKIKTNESKGNRFEISKRKTSNQTPEILAPNLVNEKLDFEHPSDIVNLKKTYGMLMKKFVNPNLDLMSSSIKSIKQLKSFHSRKKKGLENRTICNKVPALPNTESDKNQTLVTPENTMDMGWAGQPTDKLIDLLGPKVETSTYPGDIDSAFFVFPEIEEMNNQLKSENQDHKTTCKKINTNLSMSSTLDDRPTQLIKHIPKSHTIKFYNKNKDKKVIHAKQEKVESLNEKSESVQRNDNCKENCIESHESLEVKENSGTVQCNQETRQDTEKKLLLPNINTEEKLTTINYDCNDSKTLIPEYLEVTKKEQDILESKHSQTKEISTENIEKNASLIPTISVKHEDTCKKLNVTDSANIKQSKQSNKNQNFNNSKEKLVDMLSGSNKINSINKTVKESRFSESEQKNSTLQSEKLKTVCNENAIVNKNITDIHSIDCTEILEKRQKRKPNDKIKTSSSFHNNWNKIFLKNHYFKSSLNPSKKCIVKENTNSKKKISPEFLSSSDLTSLKNTQSLLKPNKHNPVTKDTLIVSKTSCAQNEPAYSKYGTNNDKIPETHNTDVVVKKKKHSLENISITNILHKKHTQKEDIAKISNVHMIYPNKNRSSSITNVIKDNNSKNDTLDLNQYKREKSKRIYNNVPYKFKLEHKIPLNGLIQKIKIKKHGDTTKRNRKLSVSKVINPIYYSQYNRKTDIKRPVKNLKSINDENLLNNSIGSVTDGYLKRKHSKTLLSSLPKQKSLINSTVNNLSFEENRANQVLKININDLGKQKEFYKKSQTVSNKNKPLLNTNQKLSIKTKTDLSNTSVSKPRLINRKNEKVYDKKNSVSGLGEYNLDKVRKLHSKKQILKPLNLKMYGTENMTPNECDGKSLKTINIVRKNNNPDKISFRSIRRNDGLSKSTVNKNTSVFIIRSPNIQRRNLFTFEYKVNALINNIFQRFISSKRNHGFNNKFINEKSSNNNLPQVSMSGINVCFKGDEKYKGSIMQSDDVNMNKGLQSNTNCDDLKYVLPSNLMNYVHKSNNDINHKNVLKISNKLYDLKNKSNPSSELTLETYLNENKPLQTEPLKKKKDYQLEVLYSRQGIKECHTSDMEKTHSKIKIGTQDRFSTNPKVKMVYENPSLMSGHNSNLKIKNAKSTSMLNNISLNDSVNTHKKSMSQEKILSGQTNCRLHTNPEHRPRGVLINIGNKNNTVINNNSFDDELFGRNVKKTPEYASTSFNESQQIGSDTVFSFDKVDELLKSPVYYDYCTLENIKSNSKPHQKWKSKSQRLKQRREEIPETITKCRDRKRTVIKLYNNNSNLIQNLIMPSSNITCKGTDETNFNFIRNNKDTMKEEKKKCKFKLLNKGIKPLEVIQLYNNNSNLTQNRIMPSSNITYKGADETDCNFIRNNKDKMKEEKKKYKFKLLNKGIKPLEVIKLYNNNSNLTQNRIMSSSNITNKGTDETDCNFIRNNKDTMKEEKKKRKFKLLNKAIKPPEVNCNNVKMYNEPMLNFKIIAPSDAINYYQSKSKSQDLLTKHFNPKYLYNFPRKSSLETKNPDYFDSLKTKKTVLKKTEIKNSALTELPTKIVSLDITGAVNSSNSKLINIAKKSSHCIIGTKKDKETEFVKLNNDIKNPQNNTNKRNVNSTKLLDHNISENKAENKIVLSPKYQSQCKEICAPTDFSDMKKNGKDKFVKEEKNKKEELDSLVLKSYSIDRKMTEPSKLPTKLNLNETSTVKLQPKYKYEYEFEDTCRSLSKKTGLIRKDKNKKDVKMGLLLKTEGNSDKMAETKKFGKVKENCKLEILSKHVNASEGTTTVQLTSKENEDKKIVKGEEHKRPLSADLFLKPFDFNRNNTETEPIATSRPINVKSNPTLQILPKCKIVAKGNMQSDLKSNGNRTQILKEHNSKKEDNSRHNIKKSDEYKLSDAVNAILNHNSINDQVQRNTIYHKIYNQKNTLHDGLMMSAKLTKSSKDIVLGDITQDNIEKHKSNNIKNEVSAPFTKYYERNFKDKEVQVPQKNMKSHALSTVQPKNIKMENKGNIKHTNVDTVLNKDVKSNQVNNAKNELILQNTQVIDSEQKIHPIEKEKFKLILVPATDESSDNHETSTSKYLNNRSNKEILKNEIKNKVKNANINKITSRDTNDIQLMKPTESKLNSCSIQNRFKFIS